MKRSLYCGVFAFGQWYLFLLISVAFVRTAQARDNHMPNIKNDYLLVINTYTSDAPWSNAIIEPVQKWVSTERNVAVFVEHLNMLMIDNAAEFGELENSLFGKYTHKAPKGVLLLGNSTLLLKDKLRDYWGDVPIILCAEENYFGPDTAYINKSPIPKEERVPISALADDYNLTSLQTKMFPQNNVDLLRQVIPGLKEILLIGDGRYVNQQLNYDMEHLMAQKYPGLKYRFLSAANMSLEELMSLLEKIDVTSTGVLFSSWFEKTNIAGNSILRANSFRVIANLSVPVFALKSAVMNNSGMVGGYFYDEQAFLAHLQQTILSVLADTPPRKIPFYIPTEAKPTFSYPSMLLKGFSVKDFPQDSVFIDRPQTFFEQHKFSIILGASLIAVLLIAVFAYLYYRLHILNVLNEAQRRQFETIRELTNLFDNMPVAYMKAKLLYNADGEIADMEICQTNERFTINFARGLESDSYRGSELFGADLGPFLRLAKLAETEKRAITYTQYFSASDLYQNVVITPATQQGYVDAYYIDATELHHAQQKLGDTNHKLSMALEVASIVPWNWDLRKHKILCDVNRPVELSNVGQQVDEEKLSVPDTQYFSKIHKEDRERVEQAYNDLIGGRTNKVREEYRVVSHDQNGYKMDWVEAQAAVEKRDANGNPLTLVGSSLIITQRKKMEQELVDARDKAEESNRLKSAFLANMSHEIRTPLNAIVGFAGLLNSTDENEERNEYVKIIENNNELLLQLIGDILDLSKIEAGTLEFAEVPVDVNALLEEVTKSLQLRAETKNLTVVFKDRLPECSILTDRNRLNQVLINLITNSIKFTEMGGITVGYTLQKDGLLRFYVTDTGCGIAPEKQVDIFTRFVKLDNFTQGTGLGLSICKTIVNRMGGEIGVESEPGKGSTFWFTIRNVPAELNKKRVQEYTLQAVAKDQITILIAEDNISNFKLFETILKKDYRILHAWNGEEAVNLFKAHRPHIVLMDVNMPVMDGYEATAKIRKISADVPILAVTAYAYASDEQRILSQGFDGYTAKPINPHVLRSKIIDLLSTRLLLL